MEEKLSSTELPLSSPSNSETYKKEETKSNNPFSSSFPTWSSRSKCLEAYVCLILSFSNIIRYTYTLGAFGVVIFLPYAFYKLFLGIPVIVAEIMLGRYVTGNVIKMYAMSPMVEGVLGCLFFTTFASILLNFVSLLYALRYFVSSWQGQLPWKKCDQPWARINCYERGDFTSAFNKCLKNYSAEFCSNLDWETSGKQYWNNVAANSENAQSIGFSFLHLLLGIIIVIIVNYKGICSLEKCIIIFLHAPILMTTLVAFAAFLVPGALKGFWRIWYLELSHLLKIEIWIAALEDSTLSLGIGTLALPFISSHGKFIDDIMIDALVISFSDIFGRLILVAPILTVIHTIKADIPFFEDHLDAFIWISEAFTSYPYPNVFWVFLFYLAMVLLQFGTLTIFTLAVCEGSVGLLKDRVNFLYVSSLLGVVTLVLCIPFIFLPSTLNYPLAVSVVTVIFFGFLTIGMIYGVKKFRDDFHFMMGYALPIFISSTQYTAFILTFAYLIVKLYLVIPCQPIKYGVYIILGLTVLIFIFIVIIKIYQAHKNGNVLAAFGDNPDWGPIHPLLKKSRIIFDAKAVTKEFMYRQELYKKPLMKPNKFSDQNIVNLVQSCDLRHL